MPVLLRPGAGGNDLLAYWEPGAPGYEERLASLRSAHAEGFATSVSCEPLLDPADAVGLVADVRPFVTDTIWIGKLNHVRRRCVASFEAIEAIEAGQTDAMVRQVYDALKDDPLVRWKDSYRDVIGLDAE